VGSGGWSGGVGRGRVCSRPKRVDAPQEIVAGQGPVGVVRIDSRSASPHALGSERETAGVKTRGFSRRL